MELINAELGKSFDNICFVINATEQQFEFYLSTYDLLNLLQSENIKTKIILL